MCFLKLRKLIFALPLCLLIAQIGYAADPSSPPPPSVAPLPVASPPPSPAPSQENKTSSGTKTEEKKTSGNKGDDTNLKTGVIASSGRYKHVASQGATDSEVPGDKPSPITAKITKEKSGGSCTVELTNTSDMDSYSVNYAVLGKDDRGSTVLRNTFSASLGPKKSQSKRVTCRKELNMEVQLTSGRKTN